MHRLDRAALICIKVEIRRTVGKCDEEAGAQVAPPRLSSRWIGGIVKIVELELIKIKAGSRSSPP
jgi:hypothetical protein